MILSSSLLFCTLSSLKFSSQNAENDQPEVSGDERTVFFFQRYCYTRYISRKEGLIAKQYTLYMIQIKLMYMIFHLQVVCFHYTDILYCLVLFIIFASVKPKLEPFHYWTLYATISTSLYTEFWQVNILESGNSDDTDKDERTVSRWEIFLRR